MVMRKPSLKKETTRNLLAYLFETEAWKSYEKTVVNNAAYWIEADPKRAERMFAMSLLKRKGYSVIDFICDVQEFVFASKYKPATKERLYYELDELEKYHRDNDTINVEL